MTPFATFVAVLAGLALALALAGRAGLLKGRPPSLGVRDGKLKPPSRTPNSVSSQAKLYPNAPQKDYAAIAPFPVRGEPPRAIDRLREIVAAMPGAKIIDSQPGYLYAQFTSAHMQFVDDTEFWFSQNENTIHVRSASRIGRRDFNVNRKRVEAIRDRYLQS
jgi:uncharacterized protein (DUF1499 family)